MLFDPVELRILAALVEKEVTTPEYYPLTLNALVAACNQKSNRDPVVSYEEDTVADALNELSSKGLVECVTPHNSRVDKFEHRFAQQLNLGRRELALLDVLILRGAQTLGELHARTARLHDFSDLGEIERTLEKLMTREPEPLVIRLTRAPGAREPRYMHLLSGPVEAVPAAAEAATTPVHDGETMALREEIARLESELHALRDEFHRFRDQFG